MACRTCASLVSGGANATCDCPFPLPPNSGGPWVLTYDPETGTYVWVDDCCSDPSPSMSLLCYWPNELVGQNLDPDCSTWFVNAGDVLDSTFHCSILPVNPAQFIGSAYSTEGQPASQIPYWPRGNTDELGAVSAFGGCFAPVPTILQVCYNPRREAAYLIGTDMDPACGTSGWIVDGVDVFDSTIHCMNVGGNPAILTGNAFSTEGIPSGNIPFSPPASSDPLGASSALGGCFHPEPTILEVCYPLTGNDLLGDRANPTCGSSWIVDGIDRRATCNNISFVAGGEFTGSAYSTLDQPAQYPFPTTDPYGAAAALSGTWNPPPVVGNNDPDGYDGYYEIQFTGCPQLVEFSYVQSSTGVAGVGGQLYLSDGTLVTDIVSVTSTNPNYSTASAGGLWGVSYSAPSTASGAFTGNAYSTLDAPVQYPFPTTDPYGAAAALSGTWNPPPVVGNNDPDGYDGYYEIQFTGCPGIVEISYDQSSTGGAGIGGQLYLSDGTLVTDVLSVTSDNPNYNTAIAGGLWAVSDSTASSPNSGTTTVQLDLSSYPQATTGQAMLVIQQIDGNPDVETIANVTINSVAVGSCPNSGVTTVQLDISSYPQATTGQAMLVIQQLDGNPDVETIGDVTINFVTAGSCCVWTSIADVAADLTSDDPNGLTWVADIPGNRVCAEMPRALASQYGVLSSCDDSVNPIVDDRDGGSEEHMAWWEITKNDSTSLTISWLARATAGQTSQMELGIIDASGNWATVTGTGGINTSITGGGTLVDHNPLTASQISGSGTFDLSGTNGTVYVVAQVESDPFTGDPNVEICNLAISSSVETGGNDCTLDDVYEFAAILNEDDPNGNTWTVSAVNDLVCADMPRDMASQYGDITACDGTTISAVVDDRDGNSNDHIAWWPIIPNDSTSITISWDAFAVSDPNSQMSLGIIDSNGSLADITAVGGTNTSLISGGTQVDHNPLGNSSIPGSATFDLTSIDTSSTIYVMAQVESDPFTGNVNVNICNLTIDSTVEVGGGLSCILSSPQELAIILSEDDPDNNIWTFDGSRVCTTVLTSAVTNYGPITNCTGVEIFPSSTPIV